MSDLSPDPWEEYKSKKQENAALSRATQVALCKKECTRLSEECAKLNREFKNIFPLRLIKRQKNLNRRTDIIAEWGVWLDKWKHLP